MLSDTLMQGNACYGLQRIDSKLELCSFSLADSNLLRYLGFCHRLQMEKAGMNGPSSVCWTFLGSR